MSDYGSKRKLFCAPWRRYSGDAGRGGRGGRRAFLILSVLHDVDNHFPFRMFRFDL